MTKHPAALVVSNASMPLKEALDAHRDRKEARNLQNPRLVLTKELRERLVFERDNLANLDLRNADLTEFGERLRGANLEGTDLTGADLSGTVLWDTHLKRANLTNVIGLRPNRQGDAHPLSGADLTEAILPPDIASFTILSNVAEVSKNAGFLFTALLGASAFMLLIVLKTKDIQIILNNSTATMPIINAEIPISILFRVGPILLFVLYCAFHFYLHRLWEMIADLPAVFPDGMPMTRKTFPWLFNELGRQYFPRLADRPQPLVWAQWLLFTILAYWLIPVTLFLFWARYLVRRDWSVTGPNCVLAGAFLATILVFMLVSFMVLSRNSTLLNSWRTRLPQRSNRASLKWIIVGLMSLLSIGWTFVFLEASRNIFEGYPVELFQSVNETGNSADIEDSWRDSVYNDEFLLFRDLNNFAVSLDVVPETSPFGMLLGNIPDRLKEIQIQTDAKTESLRVYPKSVDPSL